MNAYKVAIAAGVAIHAGILVLHSSQAQARMHRLTALGDNRYEVRDPPVWFKRGETFGLEGELPKGMGRSVEAIPIAALGKWVLHRPRPPLHDVKRILQISQATEQQTQATEQQNAAARARTRNATKQRWVKRDEAKAKVLRDWEKEPSRFRGGAAAARHYTEWLAMQGYRFETDAVTGRILDHAKKRGIKFR